MCTAASGSARSRRAGRALLGRGELARTVSALGASWRIWGGAVEAARGALARRVELLTRARHPPARAEWAPAPPPAPRLSEHAAVLDGLSRLLSAQIESGVSYAYKLSDFRRLEPRDQPTRREQMRAALTPRAVPAAPRVHGAGAHARGGGRRAPADLLSGAHLGEGAPRGMDTCCIRALEAIRAQTAAWPEAGPQRRHPGAAADGHFGAVQPPAGWTSPVPAYS